MNVRDLTPIEIADLLYAAWLADRGNEADGLDETTRAALADRLGCDGTSRLKPGPRGRTS